MVCNSEDYPVYTVTVAHSLCDLSREIRAVHSLYCLKNYGSDVAPGVNVLAVIHYDKGDRTWGNVVVAQHYN